MQNMAIFACMEKDFEDYWKKHRASLLLAAPKDLQEERNRSEKLNTFGDWLLYLAPIVVMVAFLDQKFVASELLNFLASIGVGVVATFLSMLLKPYVTGKRRVADIENDMKAYFYGIYQTRGLDALEAMRQ